MSELDTCLSAFATLSEEDKIVFVRNLKRNNPELLPTASQTQQPEQSPVATPKTPAQWGEALPAADWSIEEQKQFLQVLMPAIKPLALPSASQTQPHKESSVATAKTPTQWGKALPVAGWSIEEQTQFLQVLMPAIKHLAYITIFDNADANVRNLPEQVRKDFATKLGFSQFPPKMHSKFSIRTVSDSNSIQYFDVPSYMCPIIESLSTVIKQKNKCGYELATLKRNQDVILDLLRPSLFSEKGGYNEQVVSVLNGYTDTLIREMRTARTTAEQRKQYKNRVQQRRARQAAAPKGKVAPNTSKGSN